MPDEVPVVGQGTWEMAESRQNATEIEALRAGIARGLTHIDTAEMYGGGGAEQLIADAIRGIPRSDLFIVSKVLPQNASRAGTLRACEQTLRRLGVDHLDVYLLHWRGRVPLAETLGALEELVDQGKIRALGVSNFDVDDLEEARALLRKHPIACNQVLYHLGSATSTRSWFRSAEARHRGCRLQPVRTRPLPVAVARRRPRARRRRGPPPGDTRQVALAFLPARRRCSPSPRHRPPRTPRRTRARWTSRSSANDVAEIDAAFPVRAGTELPTI